jgi:hypothetical protein
MGAGLLMAAILGIPIGLFMLLAMPYAWMYGALVLVVSLIYLGYALSSREKTKEGHEKPMMDVATPDHEDEEDQ